MPPRSNGSEARHRAPPRACGVRAWIGEAGAAPVRPRRPGRRPRSPVRASRRLRYPAGQPGGGRALRLRRGDGGQPVRDGQAFQRAAMPGERALAADRQEGEGGGGGQRRSHRGAAGPEHGGLAHRHLALHQRRGLGAGAQPLGLLRARRRLPGAPRHRGQGRRLRPADLRDRHPQLPGALPRPIGQRDRPARRLWLLERRDPGGPDRSEARPAASPTTRRRTSGR
jgi:hypothetical protein